MSKMNNLMYIALAFTLFLVQNSKAQGIDFEHGTWEEVKAKAEKENKPIFVDAYTTWCGPCKWMAKNVFNQEEVGAFLNENFIAYKMDMEKGEGPAFAKENNVNAYPTLLYFNPQGKMIHKGVGARDADGLIALCNDAIDERKQLSAFVEKYEGGERSKAFLNEYLGVLMACGGQVEVPFGELWKILSDNEKQTNEMLPLMAAASSRFGNFNNSFTQYFLKHQVAYKKVAKKEVVDAYLNNCYVGTVWQIAQLDDKKKEKEMSKDLLAAFPSAKKEFKKRLVYMETTLETPPDKAKIQKAYVQYLKVTNDAKELNSAAWNAYEQEDDLKKLKLALTWVDRAIGMGASYFNLDTKAALLYKVKNYEEAKVYAERALKAAEKAGFEEMPEATVLLLENINAKLGKGDNASN